MKKTDRIIQIRQQLREKIMGGKYTTITDGMLIRIGCLFKRQLNKPFFTEISTLILVFCETACAMLQYAEWVGEWNDYHKSFRWQKLQGGDHSALGDCRATLDVIRQMAESE